MNLWGRTTGTLDLIKTFSVLSSLAGRPVVLDLVGLIPYPSLCTPLFISSRT